MLDNWFNFILTSLACFRLTRLITNDKIMDWFRRMVKREAPTKLKKKAEQGIECPFCVSFYFATLLTCCHIIFTSMEAGFPAIVFGAAVWGMSVLFNQIFVALTAQEE